jgi:hypothetical protein
MSAQRMCAICNEREATKECATCGKPLCDICAKEVAMEETSPTHRVKGISTAGPTSPAVRKKYFCPDCLREVDIF